MHRDLVVHNKWIKDEDYREGIALAQLALGPLGAQLAIYIGYVHYKIKGATLAGLAFVIPSFIMVIALGIAYVEFGGLPWIQAMFYGVGSSVIGIIALSSCKLAIKTPLLFTVIPVPYFKRYGKHPGIKAFVDGVTAAASGAIAGAVLNSGTMR